MADPFSIIGLLRATAGLTTFLLKSVQHASITIERASKCERMLHRYDKRFKVLKLEYQEWTRTWASALRSATNATEAWGSLDWKDITTSLKGILKEEENIRNIIYGKSLRSRECDIDQQWEDVARIVWSSSEPQSIEPQHANIALSLAFALWDEKLLEDHIRALEEYIRHIRKTADSAFRREHGLAMDEPLLEDAIDDVSATWRRAEDFWNQMSEAYQQLNGSGQVWSLVLKPPNLPHRCRFDYDDDIKVQLFGTEGGFHTEASGTTISVDYHFSESSKRPRLNKSFASALKSPVPSSLRGYLGESLKTIFLLSSKQSQQTQKLWQFRLREERAQLALYIISWCILVWRSNWVENLCNCGMRYATFPTQCTKVLVFGDSCLTRVPCFGPGVHQRRHLLLGIALSELAIQQPIKGFIHHREPRFRVIGKNTDLHEQDEILHIADLLELVRDHTSRLYKDAVQYCFNMDLRKQSQKDFTPQDVKSYIRKAIAPLQEHIDILDTHGKLSMSLRNDVDAHLEGSMGDMKLREGWPIQSGLQ